jgi:hypothetical protein
MRSLEYVLSLAIALSVGCGTTASIEHSWRSPTAKTGELTHVVTLCRSRNEAICRSAEDKLASRLAAKGVRAVPAYRVLNRDQLADRARALDALHAAGFNGLVTMRFVGREHTFVAYPSMDMYWGWGTEVVPETITRIEINAYSLANNQLVWSGISKSIDADNVHELIDDVTAVASHELLKQRVIVGTR